MATYDADMQQYHDFLKSQPEPQRSRSSRKTWFLRGAIGVLGVLAMIFGQYMSLIACAVLAIAAIVGNIVWKSDTFISGSYCYSAFFDKEQFRVTFTPEEKLLVETYRRHMMP